MERLTERKYGEIVSYKRERTQIHCSTFCNQCSQGAGNCGYVREMIDKLAGYEDAEEQGLLLRLPCKVGDTVYEISRVEPYRNPAIREMGVVDILLRDNDMYFTLQDLYDEYYDNSILSTEFGLTVFLTREEAEKALKQMGE